MHDLIIIGAGPAGLAAAIYAARAELDYVLIEENFVNGGQIIDTYEIDNYPGIPGISGMDLAQKMADHAEKLGAEVVNAAVEGLDLTGDVKKVMTDEGTFEAKAVIIASGASHSHLGVPGEEELSGTHQVGVLVVRPHESAVARRRHVKAQRTLRRVRAAPEKRSEPCERIHAAVPSWLTASTTESTDPPARRVVSRAPGARPSTPRTTRPSALSVIE